jgi:hypothetical protein
MAGCYRTRLDHLVWGNERPVDDGLVSNGRIPAIPSTEVKSIMIQQNVQQLRGN